MKAFESIPMPSEEEKAQAITEILSASDLTGVGLRAQLASIKSFPSPHCFSVWVTACF